MTNITDWQRATAPELTDFEDMAEAAWSRLPETFRARAGDVLIRVEDYPTDEVLDSLGIDDPLDLLGLYHGVSLDKKSLSDLPSQPDMVFLYRRPMLDEWAESGVTPGGPHHPRAGARNRPPFRPFRRRHGAHRGGGGRLNPVRSPAAQTFVKPPADSL